MDQHFDIVIVGAGIVGLYTACALANSGRKVALIDRNSPKSTITPEFDLRVFAITRVAKTLLQRIEVWDDIVAHRVCPFRKMQVWDGEGDGKVTFDCRDIGEPELGHIIEQQVLRAALLKRLQACSQVTFLHPVELKSVKFSPKQVAMETSAGNWISADLLIAADGANSWIRQQTENSLSQSEYGHHALVTMLTLEKTHAYTAWQRFLPTGPLVFLPLSDPHKVSIVWSSNPDHIKALTAMPVSQFQQACREAIVEDFGDIQSQTPRVHFPLVMRHVHHYVKPRLALIGDAAHTLHPLAGQGLNLGFLDASVLVDEIQRGIKEQRDIGSYGLLRRYERRRKGHNWLMATVIGGFKSTFESQNPLIRFGRNLGLNVSNRIPILKNSFAKFAMGIDWLR